MDVLRINTFGRAAPQETAAARGFYQAEQLEVEHHVTQSSKQQMQELIDGVWDVVHTNADNVFWWAHDRGADIVIVLATPGRPNQDLIVRPEIGGYPDLQGKALAVDAAESGFATPLRLLLSENGLAHEGTDYRFLEVGATQQRVEALLAGEAFGAMIGAGQYSELRQQGFTVLDTINRLYDKYAGSAAVRREWAESRSDLLVRYVRAYLRSTRSVGGDGAPPPSPFCWEGLAEMLASRVQAGLIPDAIDPHRFADDRYYLQALATL